MRNRAAEILSQINGISTLILGMRVPIEISRIVRVNDDGTRTGFLDVSTCFVLRPIPRVRTLEKDGTVSEVNLSDSIPIMLKAARSNDSVAKVLRLVGTGSYDCGNLYNIYEVIENDVGGVSNLEKLGWVTEKAIRSFKHTANSPGIIGDSARHGVQKTAPPKAPMSFSEAKSLIEGIAQAWVRSKT